MFGAAYRNEESERSDRGDFGLVMALKLANSIGHRERLRNCSGVIEDAKMTRSPSPRRAPRSKWDFSCGSNRDGARGLTRGAA